MMPDKGAQIIDMAREMGAALAGIASVEQLRESPSHQILNMDTGLEIADFAGITWPAGARSALVIAVSHPKDEPELDWWNVDGSPGNRALIRICRDLSTWIQQELGIQTQRLPYSVQSGGIYLKDTAVLAGLGCIGRSNLLVTPELGPRVRLRAMLLEAALAPTGPIAFDPCQDCEGSCRDACPQHAFDETVLSPAETGMAACPGRDGRFARARCMVQMDQDLQDSAVEVSQMEVYAAVDLEGVPRTKERIQYCRRCELACPVGS
jgi:epoxyqueuosine reductase